MISFIVRIIFCIEEQLFVYAVKYSSQMGNLNQRKLGLAGHALIIRTGRDVFGPLDMVESREQMW